MVGFINVRSSSSEERAFEQLRWREVWERCRREACGSFVESCEPEKRGYFLIAN